MKIEELFRKKKGVRKYETSFKNGFDPLCCAPFSHRGFHYMSSLNESLL